MLTFWYCVQVFLFPLLLCPHSLKKRIIFSSQAFCICLVFATGQKRSKAVLLFCWTHGKSTSGRWAMMGCPLHATKTVNIPSIYYSNPNLQRAVFSWWKLSVLHKSTAENCGRYFKDARLPSALLSLVIRVTFLWQQPAFFRPATPFLYCASLYFLFVGTLLFQLGQCLHTFSFYLYVNVFCL